MMKLIRHKVKNELEWFVFYHHVLEIILSKVFTLCLGPSKSPDIPLLKMIKETCAALVKLTDSHR